MNNHHFHQEPQGLVKLAVGCWLPLDIVPLFDLGLVGDIGDFYSCVAFPKSLVEIDRFGETILLAFWVTRAWCWQQSTTLDSQPWGLVVLSVDAFALEHSLHSTGEFLLHHDLVYTGIFTMVYPTKCYNLRAIYHGDTPRNSTHINVASSTSWHGRQKSFELGACT